MAINKALAAAAVLALAGAGTARAQTGRGARVLTLPASARAAAMGNALLPGGEPMALFYNPALLDSAGTAGVDVARYGAQGTLASAAASTGAGGGAVSFGVQALSYATSGDAGLTAPGDVGLRDGGPVGASEVSAGAAYARRLGPVRFGAGARYVQQRTGDAQDAGWAVDVGASMKAGPAVLGIAGRSLGPDLEVGGAMAKMPMALRVDAALPSTELGPLDVAAAAALTVPAGGQVLPGAGVEVGYYPIEGRTFAARAGVRRGYAHEPAVLTLGGGLAWDKLSIDYAYEGLRGGPAHRVGLTWR